jgi:hypothetical protein
MDDVWIWYFGFLIGYAASLCDAWIRKQDLWKNLFSK